MLRVYKRLLLFLFQLTAADVATLVRQVQKKKKEKRFTSLQCVVKKRKLSSSRKCFLFVMIQL